MNGTSTIASITPEALAGRVHAGEPLRLIDVRSAEEFAAYHARGAISIPLDQLSAERVRALPGEGPVYVICRSGVRSARACGQLAEARFDSQPISVAGGTEAWAKAGLPIERALPSAGGAAGAACALPGGSLSRSADPEQAIMNRVRIIAGSLVLIGTILGLTVHPGFHGLALVVGLGLLHAGLSGTCMMGTLLGRLLGGR
jgi:rhodanese-related sulfurtransferase